MATVTDEDTPNGPTPKKLPLVQPIGARSGGDGLATDSRMVNMCAERTAEGMAAVKRSGTAFFTRPPAPAGATAQGQFLLQDILWSILSDVAYSSQGGSPIAIAGNTMPNTPYEVLSDSPNNTTLLKNAVGLWVVVGSGITATITKVTDLDYPALTVPGVALLDGTYYVMDSSGNIYGSDLEDPTSWNALNFIAGDAAYGKGRGVIRHLNYIVGMFEFGCQLFYDAENPAPGSPLLPVGNAAWTTGCAGGLSLVEMADTTVWVTKNKQYGRQVLALSGLALQVISTPAIERVLNYYNLEDFTAYALKTGGHNFYVLTLPSYNTNGLTLVFDLTTGHWTQWTSTTAGVEGKFTPIGYAGALNGDFFQDPATGDTIVMSPTTYSDITGPITCRIVTPCYDWGTLNQKRFAALFLHADTVASTISVHYTDDDYQSFSALRAVYLGSVRKMLQRCGRSRRRGWELLHTDATSLKLYAMQLDMTAGEA